MINAGTIAAYLTLDTSKFKAGINSANAQLEALADKNLKTTQKVQAVGNALTTIGGTMMKNVTLPLVGAGSAALKFSTDYKTAFAGVRKTVEATDEEYKELSDDIIQMSKDMPTAIEDISSVMEVAGQLDIPKEALSSFTKTMVMMNDTTNLTAESAASSLAKFANVVRMSSNDYGRLGSTIVALGNNFATTEADIVSMGTRVASTGELVGLSEPQIMAVSTALSACGINAEAGGSSISKLLKKVDVAVKTFNESSRVINSTGYSLRELELLADQDSKAFKGVAGSLGLTSTELKKYMSHAKDLQRFADVAGVSAEEFISAWGKDAVGALGLFIDGLNDTERNGKTVIEILDEMGLTEIRLSNTVQALASSEGILTEAVNLANEAWEEDTALTEEAGKRYETFASQCSMLWNNVKVLGIEIGNELVPTVKDAAGVAGDVVSWFSSLDSGTKRTIVNLGLVAAAVGPVTTVFGRLTTGVGAAIETVSTAATAFKAAGGGATGLVSALTSVISPAGLVVAGLTAVVGIGFAVYNATKDAAKGTEKLGEAMSNSINSASDFVSGIHNVTSEASKFASTLNSGIDLLDIETKISDVQDKITAITSKATSERRNLTASEIKLLNEYYEELNKLTEQQFSYYENNLSNLETVVKSGMEITSENSQQILSEAQNYKQEAVALAWKAYEEEIAILKQKYSEESELYKKGLEDAKENYQQRVQVIEDSYAKVTSTVTNSYAEQNILHSDFYEQLKKYNEDIEAENERHNNQVIENQTAFGDNWAAKWAAIYRENELFKDNIDGLNQEMANNFDANSQKIVGILTGFLTEIEDNDGQITAETREFCEEFLACYDNLPEDIKKTMEDAIAGMREALENGQPEIKESTKKLVGVIPGMAKSTLDEHSPSKVMYQIGSFAVEGLINGMESQNSAASSSISSIMSGIKTVASSVSFKSIGENAINGILSGLNSKKQSLFSTAKSIASNISSTFKSALKINSPSRVMEEIGEFTTSGMEIGLINNAGSLYDTASIIAKDTAEALSGITNVNTHYSQYPASDYGNKLDRLIEAVERLADSQTEMEVDGRAFGRLVREYV